MDFIEFSAKTVEEALTEASISLGIPSNELEYEVIEKGSTGFLGIGSKNAVIKVRKKFSVEESVKEFLNSVFKAMEMEVEIIVKVDEFDKLIDIELKGDDMGILIGKRGQTLDSLQYLTSNMRDLDILMIEHNIAKETTKTINNIRFEKPDQTYTGIQILDQRNPQNCVPFYIYRKDLLIKNGIRFRKGVYYEDSLFTPIILCYAQKIRFLSKAIYNYFQRTGSITNSRPTIKHCLDCILISKELINFSSKRDEFQNYEYKLLNNRIASIMGRFVLNWLKLDIKNKIIVLQAWSSNKDILKYVRKSNRYKTYILLHLMTLIGYFCPCR